MTRIAQVVFLEGNYNPNMDVVVTGRGYGRTIPSTVTQSGPARGEDGRYTPEACAELRATNKTYAYYTEDADIGVGDALVVDSPYGGYKVVACVSVSDTVDAIQKAAKWVVDRVDVSGHAKREANRQKREVLIARIQRAEKEARAKLEMEKLRDLSPELKGLLDELKALEA